MQVTVQPVRSSEGQLLYSLYSSREAWDSKRESLVGHLQAVEGTVIFSIDHLQPGTYALSVVHDENMNGHQDFNFLGMPTEMFGVSNIDHMLTSRPQWDEIKFEVKAHQKNQISILMKWI